MDLLPHQQKACDFRNDFEPRHIAIASRHEYRAKEARKHYPFFAIDRGGWCFLVAVELRVVSSRRFY